MNSLGAVIALKCDEPDYPFALLSSILFCMLQENVDPHASPAKSRILKPSKSSSSSEQRFEWASMRNDVQYMRGEFTKVRKAQMVSGTLFQSKKPSLENMADLILPRSESWRRRFKQIGKSILRRGSSSRKRQVVSGNHYAAYSPDSAARSADIFSSSSLQPAIIISPPTPTDELFFDTVQPASRFVRIGEHASPPTSPMLSAHERAHLYGKIQHLISINTALSERLRIAEQGRGTDVEVLRLALNEASADNANLRQELVRRARPTFELAAATPAAVELPADSCSPQDQVVEVEGTQLEFSAMRYYASGERNSRRALRVHGSL